MEHPPHTAAETPPAAEERTPGRRRGIRVAIVIGRRMAFALLWLATLALAAGIGWSVGHFGAGDELWEAWAAVLAPASGGGAVESSPPVESFSIPISHAPPPVTVNPIPVTPPGPVRPAPVKPPVRKAEPPVILEPEPEPEPVVEPAPEPALPGALERALDIERLAAAGDEGRAQAHAEQILAEFATYTNLAAAFREDGAGDVQSRLTGLHLLHLAGHESIARDVAREMRRAYIGTAEVSERIREWGILKPQIDSVETSVDGGTVRIAGAVENPDVVRVRRVRVVVEALDAGSAVIATEDARVRPKAMEPGERGSFEVEFQGLDPATIIRTRTTVVEWESAILGS